jgi:hypothetical protein
MTLQDDGRKYIVKRLGAGAEENAEKAAVAKALSSFK